MKPTFRTVLIVLVVVAVAGISLRGIAYAQGDDPPRSGDDLAELLGLTPEELREQIENGKTVQELAEEAGVDLEAYQQELQEARQENLRARIEEALANREISQDQADWLLEGLDKGYLDGPFFRFGGRTAGDSGIRHSTNRQGALLDHGESSDTE